MNVSRGRQHRCCVSRAARIVCWIGLIVTAGAGPIAAQSGGVPPSRKAIGEATVPLAPVERHVPVEQVSRLLTPDWQPISQAEFRRLLKAATPPPPGPRTTWIERAEYFAVLREESLSAGRVVYDIRHNAAKPGFLLLDPISFALTELGWKERRAIWGTVTNGRLGVLAERRSERLSGNWSQAGRRFGSRIEFELKLPPATVSRIHLQTPVGWKLESTAGHITGPFPIASLGWLGWRVDLGSRSECRLTVRRPKQKMTRRPVILVESNLTHVIRRDSLQFEAKLVVDVSQSATTSLTVRIPRGVNIESVVYGAEIPLLFNVKRMGNDQRLRIVFPDALLGKSRSIIVHGSANASLGINRVLPQVWPISGSFLPGNVSLTVMSPLKLRSLSQSGLRQTSPLTASAEGETLTFRQWRSDARIEVNVGDSPTALSAKAVSHLDLSSENWRLESSIEWTAHKGSTFELKCRLLPGWKVTGVRVRSVTAGGSENIQANWYLQRKKSG
ncbi:MAG: hypothetical protein IID45_04680, partial [Planctomycetes bacterium]|nr:hypothetical protein [Planctomycetota bacterium]